MEKQFSRPHSPTSTIFSGISNYHWERYSNNQFSNGPIRGAAPVRTIDYRQVSKTHYTEFGKYLTVYKAAAPPNSRSTSRSKLTRLTTQQFHELSTDVYDELIRRNKENEGASRRLSQRRLSQRNIAHQPPVPFLSVNKEFHPKRNQARQKLVTVPASRFEDLSSDVFFELARRYPEFKEDTSPLPPICDSNGNPGGVVSDDSAPAEGPEDAWAELKPYLEAKTDETVKAIQKVLSGVHTPAPSPMPNDNLTQIITIVSSIVAVCNDNFPPAGAAQGMEILHELGDHANKLSEVQLLPEATKDSRQIMAKSSFAIGNAMKELTKL